MDNNEFKILSIGTDANTLDKDSRIAGRVVRYGDLVDKYTVITPADRKTEVVLSDKVKVFGVVGKNKISKLYKVYFQAKKILSQEKYTIITVQDQYYLGLIAWVLSRKFKIGLEIQNHGFEKFYGLRKMIARFIFPRAGSVRTMSKRLKKRLIEEFGVKEEKITIVPVFFKPQEHFLGKEKNISDIFVFLTVGRLVPVKNIAMQIRVMKDILKENQKTELWILGTGPLENKLRKMVKDLGLEECVRFLGWQVNVAAVYERADAFLLTSTAEGWPVSVMEAAGFSLPIIMTDVGSAGELIIDKENGLVIPIGDEKALKNAMNLLIHDKDLCSRLGRNARKTILNMPSREETMKIHKRSWEKAKI